MEYEQDAKHPDLESFFRFLRFPGPSDKFAVPVDVAVPAVFIEDLRQSVMKWLGS